MSVESATLAGRRAIERLMTDCCTVVVPAATSTFDPVTGTNTPASGSTVYSGKCRLQVTQPEPTTPDAGGHRWTAVQATVSLPVSAATPPVGSFVTVTASFDPANVGRRFVVRSIFRKSHATAQRVIVDEVVE